jgi:predicted  nucleic acid-binding Zn-ribbon protein
MTPDNVFRAIYEQLRLASQEMQASHGHIVEAAQSIMQSSTHMQRAGDAMTAAMTAAIHAREEYDERQTTIEELKTLVMHLTTEVRELRAEVDRQRNGHG